MTKQQYARRYDRDAAGFYRFALYILGDADGAERVVRQAFVEGWRAAVPAGSDGAFSRAMLRILWKRCGAERTAAEEDYNRGIETARGHSGGSLPAALAGMRPAERGAVALCALFPELVAETGQIIGASCGAA